MLLAVALTDSVTATAPVSVRPAGRPGACDLLSPQMLRRPVIKLKLADYETALWRL